MSSGMRDAMKHCRRCCCTLEEDGPRLCAACPLHGCGAKHHTCERTEAYFFAGPSDPPPEREP